MRRESVFRICSVACVVSLLFPGAATAAKRKVSGKEVFQQYCASCHVAGGNLVKPSKPLTSSKTLGSYALFKAYLNSPTGHMPYYQNLCKNEKLLKPLYQYVKSLPAIKLKQATTAQPKPLS